MFKISLLFFIFIDIFSYDKTSFKFFQKEISNEIIYNGKPKECKNCIVYKFKIKDEKEIKMSIPRLYNSLGSVIYGANFTTLVTWDKDGKLYVWPDHKSGDVSYKDVPYKLNSIMGLTIDNNGYYYLLDQGKIFYENNTVESGSSKVIIIKDHKKTREKDDIYYFRDLKYVNSLLTDITVDHYGKYIYVVDSGNLLNNETEPGIIVINTETNTTHKVLHNHTSFKSVDNSNIDNSDISPDEYFSKAIGVNSIQISCNDETLYYSSQQDKNIYSVSTKDIINAIKKYEDSKNINDLKNIEVNIANQNFLNQDFVLSSKNNIFMINKESNEVDISFYIDDDLSHFNYQLNSKISYNDTIIPSSIDLVDGNLYLLENVIDKDNGKNTYNIYKAELKKDELGNNIGCTVFVFKLYGLVIFLFVWFLGILGITVLLIIVNSGNKLEKSNIQKQLEKEEEINELNRQLNEGNDDNK